MWVNRAPKTIGFTLITGGIIQAVLYQYKEGGESFLLAREEFSAQSDSAERKRLGQTFLSKAGRHARFVHLLMRERALTKQFRFPSNNLEEISQMLALRLPREIPFSLDQIVYHFHPIGEDQPNNFQTEVLLFGVAKELINQERELLKSFGIFPHQVVLSTVVLSDYVKKKMGATSVLPKAIFYGGGGKGEFVLLRRDRIQLSRSFSYDPLDAVFSIQDETQSIFDSLERQDDTKLFDLCFCGELAKFKDELFAGRFPNRFNLNLADKNLSYIEFFLHAAASTYQEKRQLNLLPADAKQHLAATKSQDVWSRLRISLVIFAATVILTSVFSSIRMLVAITSLNQKISSLEPSVQATKEIARAVQTLDILKAKKMRALDIFVRVHERASEGISLIEFDYNDKEETVRLKGRADSQSLVDQYVRQLGTLPWFSRVDLQYSESTNEGLKSQFQFSINASFKQKGNQK